MTELELSWRQWKKSFLLGHLFQSDIQRFCITNTEEGEGFCVSDS